MVRLEERLEDVGGTLVLLAVPIGRVTAADADTLCPLLLARAAAGAGRLALDLSQAELTRDSGPAVQRAMRSYYAAGGRAGVLVGSTANHGELTRSFSDWGCSPLHSTPESLRAALARAERYRRPLPAETVPSQLVVEDVGDYQDELLLVAVAPGDPAAPVTRLGGLALLPIGVAWPPCPECGLPQQLLGQLQLADAGFAAAGLLPVMRCINLGRGCQSVWRPRLRVVTGELALVPGPRLAPDQVSDIVGLPVLAEIDGVRVVPGRAVRRVSAERRMQTPPYEVLRNECGFPVLGKLGGQPDWLQHPEYPACPGCHRAMRFVAQLDEAGGGGIDFGGGLGYVFACQSCGEGALVSQR